MKAKLRRLCQAVIKDGAKLRKAQEAAAEIRTQNIAEAGRWVEVGKIGVDAGMCWLGDPCYFVKDSRRDEWGMKDDRPDYIKDYMKFLDKLYKLEKRGVAVWPFTKGHDGFGVTVSSGGSDGLYPVYVKRSKEGLVGEVRIVFIPEDNND